MARYYGIVPEYRDAQGRLRVVSLKVILRVLQAWGVSDRLLEDLPAALRRRRQALWRRGLAPVLVAWEGRQVAFTLRLPESASRGPAAARFLFENGRSRTVRFNLSRFPVRRHLTVGRRRFVARRVLLRGPYPLGYHTLRLKAGGERFEAMVICAPLKAYGAKERKPTWGVFLPLYALHSERSWGAGDLSDLERLARWVRRLGAKVVSTLPLFSSLLSPGEPFEFSPYAPASRLFLNEFYLDVTRVPEFSGSRAAQALVRGAGFQARIQALRRSPWVDYRRQTALKREVLEQLAGEFWSQSRTSPRRKALEKFLRSAPELTRYARYRARLERRWDRATLRYHLYAQWLVQEQLAALARRLRRLGMKLYLDLPLGVHPLGYDIRRDPGAFALSACAGAPPDPFFIHGQNWGFPPFHPERLRRQHYRPYLAILRCAMRFSGILRLDHAMGLHRLFWIPQGVPASEGAYVRYPAEEFYALLCLESHRHRCRVAGEDLGTVPPVVRPAMQRHGISGLYVLQYELFDAGKTLRRPWAEALASMNTHDMPPFAAAWSWLPFRIRFREKMPGPRRDFSVQEGMASSLRFLSAGGAGVVVVNLEDLWLEPRPQNVPGTWRQRPNWRRKARYGLEEFSRMPQVLELLQEVNRLRHGERREGSWR